MHAIATSQSCPGLAWPGTTWVTRSGARFVPPPGLSKTKPDADAIRRWRCPVACGAGRFSASNSVAGRLPSYGAGRAFDLLERSPGVEGWGSCSLPDRFRPDRSAPGHRPACQRLARALSSRIAVALGRRADSAARGGRPVRHHCPRPRGRRSRRLHLPPRTRVDVTRSNSSGLSTP
jgi:hypothetical protein